MMYIRMTVRDALVFLLTHGFTRKQCAFQGIRGGCERYLRDPDESGRAWCGGS